MPALHPSAVAWARHCAAQSRRMGRPGRRRADGPGIDPATGAMRPLKQAAGTRPAARARTEEKKGQVGAECAQLRRARRSISCCGTRTPGNQTNPSPLSRRTWTTRQPSRARPAPGRTGRLLATRATRGPAARPIVGRTMRCCIKRTPTAAPICAMGQPGDQANPSSEPCERDPDVMSLRLRRARGPASAIPLPQGLLPDRDR
jgi:hypothetical protein